ncbi:MAG: hypothetical protein Q6363_007945 [Candidatus Njordarchaeota archaeon]
MNKKELLEKIKKIVDSNPWLSGMVDFADGDIFAIVNMPERFVGEPTEAKTIKELLELLLNYEGTFRYKNLLFFNSYHYGTFVYDLTTDCEDYVEHLSIFSETTPQQLWQMIKDLIKER